MLLASGGAYRCYASQAELEEMRETAKKEGRPLRYDGRWRDRDPAEAPAGVKPVIRLRAPQDGATVVEDKVQGRVTWANKDLDDFVLLRSDGTPTYMLAVVVDDRDMGVTQIIRGDDHLTNAARQTQIYQAMDWPVPAMAHVPLIHGADGAKLSNSVRDALEAVTEVAPPAGLLAAMDRLGREGRALRFDADTVPHRLVRALEAAGGTATVGTDPIALMKASKREAERQGSREAHRRDAAAFARFLPWLAAALALALIAFGLVFNYTRKPVVVISETPTPSASTPEVIQARDLLNPADAYRLFNLTGTAGVSAFSGMAGMAQNNTLHPSALIAALAAWALVPLGIAAFAFSRREL